MQQKFELKSKLHDIISIVNQIKEFEDKRSKALELIAELNIKDMDKKKMLCIIQYQKHNSNDLTMYLYNAMLKFEGLGTIQRKSE